MRYVATIITLVFAAIRAQASSKSRVVGSDQWMSSTAIRQGPFAVSTRNCAAASRIRLRRRQVAGRGVGQTQKLGKRISLRWRGAREMPVQPLSADLGFGPEPSPQQAIKQGHDRLQRHAFGRWIAADAQDTDSAGIGIIQKVVEKGGLADVRLAGQERDDRLIVARLCLQRQEPPLFCVVRALYPVSGRSGHGHRCRAFCCHFGDWGLFRKALQGRGRQCLEPEILRCQRLRRLIHEDRARSGKILQPGCAVYR